MSTDSIQTNNEESDEDSREKRNVQREKRREVIGLFKHVGTLSLALLAVIGVIGARLHGEGEMPSSLKFAASCFLGAMLTSIASLLPIIANYPGRIQAPDEKKWVKRAIAVLTISFILGVLSLFLYILFL